LWPCFAGAYDGFGLAGQHAGRGYDGLVKKIGLEANDGGLWVYPRTIWLRETDGLMLMYSRLTSVSTQREGRSTIVCALATFHRHGNTPLQACQRRRKKLRITSIGFLLIYSHCLIFQASLTKTIQQVEKFPTMKTERIRDDVTIKLGSSRQLGRQVEL